MKRKHIRTLQQVLEDGLWPYQGLSPNPEESRRHFAVAEVLRCIPEDDYNNLKSTSFNWFIPHQDERDLIMPFGNIVEEKKRAVTYEYAKVLYLSPFLERTAF